MKITGEDKNNKIYEKIAINDRIENIVVWGNQPKIGERNKEILGKMWV